MIVPIETVRRRVAELMVAGLTLDEAVHSTSVALGLPIEAVQQAVEHREAQCQSL